MAEGTGGAGAARAPAVLGNEPLEVAEAAVGSAGPRGCPSGRTDTDETWSCPPAFRAQAGHLDRRASAAVPLNGHEPLPSVGAIGVLTAGRAAARRAA